MRGVKICSCEVCGWRGFPHRQWCPNCGSFETRPVLVETGVVEQVTTVHRATGRPDGSPVTIGTVHTNGGAQIIARLQDVRVGDRVGLYTEDSAFVARALQQATHNDPVAE